MFKMLKVIDFVTLIIAVTALIISIVCMNKKCDNFGDTACGVPGKLGEGESCILDSAICGRPGSEELYCGEKLTCDDGKCKSGESKEMCTGKNKDYCPGSGPSPGTNRCSFIENGRGNVICNETACPVCGKGCNRFYGKNGTTVCGIISENPNPYQIELDRACSNPNSDHERINCDIPNATQSQKDQACENLCGGSSKCINGNCTMSLFTDVNM